MSELAVYVRGISFFGPGLFGWEPTRAVLAGHTAYVAAATQLPVIDALPPNERRRAGLSIRLALAVGGAAVRHAEVDATQLATVFSSTGGDCDNCHGMLDTLASTERAVSPTRFHNSVHNAPAGYWSIAAACMAPSTSLCAYDATFAAGLLEAATQARVSGGRCLLLAYDTAYPEPLHAVRPIPHAVGVGMVLDTVNSSGTLPALTLAPARAAATTLADAPLEALRRSVPAARSLPLLQQLACGGSGRVIIDYLDELTLAVEVRA